MLKLFSITKSRHALTAGFGVLLLLIIIVTLFGISRLYSINQRIEGFVYHQNFKSGLLVSLLTINRQRQEVLYQLQAAGDAAAREHAFRDYRALAGQLFATLDELQGLQLVDPERAAVTEALDAATAAHEVRDKVVELLMQRKNAAAAALLESKGLVAQERFHESLYRLIDLGRGATLESVTQASRAMREAWLLVALVGMLVLVLGAWVANTVIRQITRSEDALHREKELAEVTLHSIGDGVITVDAQGHIDYMNPVAEQFTGWSNAQARDQPLDAVYRVVDEQTGKPIPHPGGSESGARGTSGLAVRLLGRSGNACAIRDSFAPRHNGDGNLVGWVVVFHDVNPANGAATDLAGES